MSDGIAVVGTGRLGACLVRALTHSGLRVTALATRAGDDARALDRELQLGAAVVSPSAVVRHAELIVLCVPDDRIAELVGTLEVGPAHAIVHCSGALDLTPLMAAGARGSALGVFHPLQSFSAGAPASHFAGVGIGVDSREAADGSGVPLRARLEQLAVRIGAVPFSLAGVDRARYHAAAVFASNYVVALHAISARIWQSAGLPAASARPLLAALTRGAADNLATHGLADALTGPLARGDVLTIERHLEALATDPASLTLYRALARELLALPLALPQATHAALAALTEPAETDAVL
jgi:predicted short-subunit dehydrogenase-like oxidoreductase (DUF2520 family)